MCRTTFAVLLLTNVIVLVASVTQRPDTVNDCEEPDRCVATGECPSFLNVVDKREFTFCRGTSYVCCDPSSVLYEKSHDKCQEFYSVAHQNVKSVKLSARHGPSLNENDDDEFGAKSMAASVPEASVCKTRVDNYQVTDTSTLELSHLVYIAYEEMTIESRYNCDGSLISGNFVLTSAFCVNYKRKGVNGQMIEAKYVKAGEHFTNTVLKVAHLKKVAIIQRIPHPDFNANSHKHNIGLLKLESDIPITFTQMPICLPQHDNVPHNVAFVQRLRLLNNKRKEKSYTVDVPALAYVNNTDVCVRHFNTVKANEFGDALQYCVILHNPTKEERLAHFDMGGPLQLHNLLRQCTQTIIGVASHIDGTSVFADNVPVIYTKVFPYMKWIERYVWA